MIKLVKKMMIIFISIVIISETLVEAVPNNRSHISTNPINVGVVFYTFNDPYVTSLRESLENIEKKNKGTIKFSFYDSENDEAIQNQNINTLVEGGSVDLLILSLVDLKNDPQKIVGKVKEKNIPVIFASKRTLKVDPQIVKSYTKSYYVVPNSEHSGELQGKIVADLWNESKSTLDTNKDNIMQYIMLQGKPSDSETTERTKYSIMAIENAGIKVESLASRVGDWNKDRAREIIESLFMKYDGKIEVIISNNDEMAIGAIKALQKYGYNKDDKSKYIPVVGIGASPEMVELIKQGYIAGTVLQNPNVMAEALFEVGVHLVRNVRFNCKEKYKCDESERIIELPFEKYTG